MSGDGGAVTASSEETSKFGGSGSRPSSDNHLTVALIARPLHEAACTGLNQPLQSGGQTDWHSWEKCALSIYFSRIVSTWLALAFSSHQHHHHHHHLPQGRSSQPVCCTSHLETPLSGPYFFPHHITADCLPERCLPSRWRAPSSVECWCPPMAGPSCWLVWPQRIPRAVPASPMTPILFQRLSRVIKSSSSWRAFLMLRAVASATPSSR